MAKKEVPIKISVFKNSFAEEPDDQMKFEDYIMGIKSGMWSKQVLRLREIKDLKHYKKTKEALPGVTVSGEFKTRDKYVPVKQRIKRHSGLICLDIDAKDNPKLRTKDLIDRECIAQFISCSGKGIKIIYRCKETTDPQEHRRIYDAAVERLNKKGIKLKIDPIVKNIMSLQYVSYDPEAHYFPKTKLEIKPLPPIKIKATKPSENQLKDVEQLEEYIAALEGKDVTGTYEDWLTIGMGLSYSLGEAGRKIYHQLSKAYDGYSAIEVDEKYDGLVERDPSTIDRPVTLASVFQIINSKLPKVKARHLAKKYNFSHTVGVGEDIEQGDLCGFVRYRLFLFKKIVAKEDGKKAEIVDLEPKKLNLNEFEILLRNKGFYRYDNMYVQIIDNVVEKVDEHDILRIITDHIEVDGNYSFTYQKVEYNFSWEELVHLWREIRALGTTFNQIATCLTHWQPKLLKDANGVSYIPYKNGVLKVTAKDFEMVEYKSLGFQIWKERILPRDFKYTKEKGMFEAFFENINWKSTLKGEKQYPDRYKRALWYMGYMLHGFKIRSLARAWILYDIRAGNNGRTGKSLVGEAVGKIRNVTVIDGKQVDFRNNRFALQKVTPWTEVVLIDDVAKGMSLGPLFNMITGQSDTEKKGKDVLTLELKYMLTANWIMELDGTSEQGRQFITQVDDFYLRYGVKQNNCLRPIVHLHGKEFFTEWDETDWKQFDSFCIRCIQFYMSGDSPENKIVGNVMQVRFVQQHESELFYELSTTFCKHVQKTKEGSSLLISMALLVNVVKNSVDYSPTHNKCGRIVREFLTAIGCGKVKPTSMLTAGQAQMAYRIDKKFTDLDFGDITEQLSRPSL